MPSVNPQHLLEQASLLYSGRRPRRPRQADLRRAISACYYAVFHAVLTAVADEFIGKGSRSEPRYALAYRSVDHKDIKRICEEASRKTVGQKYLYFVPSGSLEKELRFFSDNYLRLYALRHEADYDPTAYFSGVDVLFAEWLASDALGYIKTVSPEGRRLFLTLLVFPPR